MLKVIDKAPLSLTIGVAQTVFQAVRPFIVRAGVMLDSHQLRTVEHQTPMTHTKHDSQSLGGISR